MENRDLEKELSPSQGLEAVHPLIRLLYGEHMHRSKYCPLGKVFTIGSLSTRVFETRTATGREDFAC